MPTESLCRLLVEGPARAVAEFRDDDSVWAVEPWRLLYGAVLDEGSTSRRLDYRYRSDWKRPGPSPADMAARYPRLRFTYESCDEFLEGAIRVRYRDGREAERVQLGAGGFGWIEFEDDDEDDDEDVGS